MDAFHAVMFNDIYYLRKANLLWKSHGYHKETVDLVTFTEEILNGKLHFLYSVKISWFCRLTDFLLFIVTNFHWHQQWGLIIHVLFILEKGVNTDNNSRLRKKYRRKRSSHCIKQLKKMNIPTDILMNYCRGTNLKNYRF